MQRMETDLGLEPLMVEAGLRLERGEARHA